MPLGKGGNEGREVIVLPPGKGGNEGRKVEVLPSGKGNRAFWSDHGKAYVVKASYKSSFICLVRLRNV
jgi:hypothetical protein